MTCSPRLYAIIFAFVDTSRLFLFTHLSWVRECNVRKLVLSDFRPTFCCTRVQMLENLFTAGDTNGDGVLDIDELTAIIRYVDPTVKSEKVSSTLSLRVLLHIRCCFRHPLCLLLGARLSSIYHQSHGTHCGLEARALAP